MRHVSYARNVFQISHFSCFSPRNSNNGRKNKVPKTFNTGMCRHLRCVEVNHLDCEVCILAIWGNPPDAGTQPMICKSKTRKSLCCLSSSVFWRACGTVVHLNPFSSSLLLESFSSFFFLLFPLLCYFLPLLPSSTRNE